MRTPPEIHQAWWDKISYGNWSAILNELHNPEFLPDIPLSELFLLQTFTFLAVKKRSWMIRAAVPFLAAGLRNRMSEPTIRRGRDGLCSRNMLLLEDYNEVAGNLYVVNPILYRGKDRTQLGHWQEASWLEQNYELSLKPLQEHDQNDLPPEFLQMEPDLSDPATRSLRSGSENFSRLEADQNDPHSIDHRSLLEEVDASRQLCPYGQIEKNGDLDKGVGLSADSIPEAREGVRPFVPDFHQQESAKIEIIDRDVAMAAEFRERRQPLTPPMRTDLNQLFAKLDNMDAKPLSKNRW